MKLESIVHNIPVVVRRVCALCRVRAQKLSQWASIVRLSTVGVGFLLS
jgi:hypothetical protein